MVPPRDHAEVVSESEVPEIAAGAVVDAPGAAVVEVEPAFRRAGAVAPSTGSRRDRPLEPQAPSTSAATQANVAMAARVGIVRARWDRRGEGIGAETRPVGPR